MGRGLRCPPDPWWVGPSQVLRARWCGAQADGELAPVDATFGVEGDQGSGGVSGRDVDGVHQAAGVLEDVFSALAPGDPNVASCAWSATGQTRHPLASIPAPQSLDTPIGRPPLGPLGPPRALIFLSAAAARPPTTYAPCSRSSRASRPTAGRSSSLRRGTARGPFYLSPRLREYVLADCNVSIFCRSALALSHLVVRILRPATQTALAPRRYRGKENLVAEKRRMVGLGTLVVSCLLGTVASCSRNGEDASMDLAHASAQGTPPEITSQPVFSPDSLPRPASDYFVAQLRFEFEDEDEDFVRLSIEETDPLGRVRSWDMVPPQHGLHHAGGAVSVPVYFGPDHAIGEYAYSFVLLDFEGNASGATVRVSLEDPVGATPPLAISAVPSTPVEPGDTITILGNGFEDGAHEPTVVIGGRSARVVGVSADTLTVEVPSDLRSGEITIETSGGLVSGGLQVVPAPEFASFEGFSLGTSRLSRFRVTGHGFEPSQATWSVNGIVGGAPEVGWIGDQGQYGCGSLRSRLLDQT